VTINPAKHFKLDGFGTIGPETQNLTFFKFVKGNFSEIDSKGQTIIVKEKIVPIAIIVKGQFFRLEEKEEVMDIYKELKLKKVINADGRMTILGVSTFSNEVAQNMKIAGSNYFVMKDLEKNVDLDVAKMYGFEAAHIVNSASSGIALGIASLIFKDRVHDVNVQQQEKNEVVLLKGHNVNFGAPIEDLLHLVGAKVVEAGYANGCSVEDVEYRINSHTAALMYVVSHHAVQKQILSLDEMIEIAHKYQIPLIVDCASESNLKKYAQKQIDLVVFSGSKALEGPTSGVIFGRQEIINNVVKHHKNIGRTMKVGKENIIGLYTALKNYQTKKTVLEVNDFFKIIENNDYLIPTIVTDNLRPEIQRIKITLKPNTKINALELSKQLKDGEVAIYLRDYQAKEN
jgi:L-seryl-tRNA(Ser) seleniumtransferase